MAFKDTKVTLDAMAVYKFIQKNVWWMMSALYTIVIVWYGSTPVFWDMYGQVKTANYYLETNFSNLFPNSGGFTDNGYFPLYSLYLAALFKLFGFKLWVAHVSVIPFLTGLLYQLQLFCKRFLSDENTWFVLLITCIHPAIMAQSIYFSSEICFVFLGIWLLNAAHDQRASRIALSAIFLCLLNFRALPLIFLAWIYFLFVKKQKSAWYLTSAVLGAIVCMFIHFHISGWFFENPENMGHRTFLSFNGMLKNLFWCVIKLADFATIIAFIFMLLFCFNHKKLGEPIVLFSIAALSVFAFCTPLSNPISSRYFLLVYVLAIPAFMFSVSTFSFQKLAATCLLFIVFLVQSNWLIKPNRYGNAWDCNLQSLAYFEVRKELDNYITENKIAPQDVAAGFQIYFNDAFYLMNGTNKEYDLLSDTEMNSNLYIADSNICNNYNAQRKTYLEKNYTLIKGFVKGPLYINLYKRKGL